MSFELENQIIPMSSFISILNARTQTFMFSKRDLSFKKCIKKIVFSTESPKLVSLKVADGYYFKHDGVLSTKCQFIISQPCFIVFEKKLFNKYFTIKDFDRACSVPTFEPARLNK